MTVSDRDIWLSAAEMINAHGDDAWEEAVSRYFACREKSDQEGMKVWRRVARAIDDFTSRIRGESEN
jgi:hypothetical protein